MPENNAGDAQKLAPGPPDNSVSVDGADQAPAANTAQLLYTGVAVALSAALLRAGLFNSVLVIAVSALLLCNPWIRTLLELPSPNGGGRFGKYDPARFLLTSTEEHAGSTTNAEAAEHEPTNLESSSDSMSPDRQLLALSILPTPLHDSTQKMIRLVIRDFVQNWYDGNTFAHPNFLVSAEAGISHLATSVYLRTRPMESANVAAEVLLTVQSVLLSSLRRRRILARNGSRPTSPTAAYGAAAAVPLSTWPNTTARIDSLRKAVRKLLTRNLPQSERSSPVVVLLLTEIVAKQAWQVVQNISDPDFINQKIVQLAEPASETSLEGQTLSPIEVEHLKNVSMAAQPPNLASPTSPHQPIDNPVQRDLDRFPVMEPDNRTRTPILPPRSATKPLPQPRITPPRKAQTTGPFSALGGLATGALGALADAAERAVDVVGGTVDEFGNLLVVPSDSSTRSGRTSPRQQTFSPVEISREFQHRHGGSTHADHLDMPRNISQPPLPPSIRQSMRATSIENAQQAEQDADRSWAFDIPDSPERASFDAVPLVSPAPVAAANASYDSFESDDDPAAAMLELLSNRGSASYEAFENFLEDPANPCAAPNEGEMLLRLHTQLNTLASVMEFASLDEQTFRADASGILVKALDHLPGSIPPTLDGSQPVLVRRSAQQVLTNLEWCANMDVVEPLREQVVLRLVQLYNAFMSRSLQVSAVASPRRVASPEAQPLKAFLDRENRASFSSVDSDRPSLRYEPRKKLTAPSIPSHLAVQSPPRAPSVPPSAVMGPPPGPPRPMSVPPRAPSAPPRTSPGASRFSKDAEPMPKPVSLDAHKASVAVVDVSANAESPRSVDVRSFEVMIFVESVGANGDGFVLVRKWFEFEQMDAALQRLPRSSVTLPRLPKAKSMNSAQLCHVIEAYLSELLSPDVARHLANVSATRSFFDRDRAGASTEDVRRKGGPGVFLGSIGKNIVNVGKSAKIGFGVQSSGIDPVGLSSGLATMRDASAALTPKGTAPRQIDATPKQKPSTRLPDQGMRGSHDSPVPQSAQSDTSAFVSRASSPAPRETSELSARDLDMILASIFAVADEAFNLQGGWTLRRGMLRVLEQVVRTTYASSVEATFNNAAAALNADKFAQWIDDLTNSFWPDGRWDTQRGRDRTDEAKYKTAERAREIVISYAPAQAGFMLGPGGKVACVKALASIHETLMDPITASDLGLSLVLKALDVASR